MENLPTCMQGKKFPVDVFKVVPSGPAASLPPVAPVKDSSAANDDLAAAEDTSAQAANLEDAINPGSVPHILNEQMPIVGRQVALCLQAPQTYCALHLFGGNGLRCAVTYVSPQWAGSH